MTRLPKSLSLLFLLALAMAACASGPRFREVTIVHTNDLHGHVENAAAIAAVVRAERRKNPAVLFLDGGDVITGTPLSTLYQGRPIFEVMSLMGYDATVIGNHEFDHGWQRISTFMETATFPLLCANATDPDGKPIGDGPERVFEVGGVRIGVLGLVTDGVPALTTRAASEGCSFESPIAVAKRRVPELRKKCDVVVLLTHAGVEADAALAGAVPGIDLIVGGHTHTRLAKPLEVNGTRIVQASCYGRAVGIVRLTWDTEEHRVTTLEGALVDIDARTMPNAGDVQELVQAWETQVEAKVGEVIGTAPQKLGKRALRRRIEHIYKEVLGADFGYQNNGGIRADLQAGEVSIRDVWTILPFDNTLVRIKLKGDRVPKYARKRLGKAFDPAKEYVFGTNSYVGDQREKYFQSADVPVEDTGLLMRDVVVDWVRKNGGFDPRKTPPDPR